MARDEAAMRRDPLGDVQDPLEAASRIAPYLIVGYALLLLALRLSFSRFLEVDEAEFVGRADFRLVYDNAHPPLFNWLVRLLLEITGWNWAVSVAVVKYGALAAFHWASWSTAHRLGGPRAGALALAAAAFLPQVVWMSATTLAHSTLVLAGAALTVNAALRAMDRPSWPRFALVGAAMAVGALAKFNFVLFAAPFLVVLALDPATRGAFYRREAWAALAVAVVAVGPTAVTALMYPEQSAARVDKLFRDGGAFAPFDVPALGVDGFLALAAAALAWAAPALAVWAAARGAERSGRLTTDPADAGVRFAAVLEAAMLGALALAAVAVLAGDVHSVHERYLTPVLAALPIVLAVRWPLGRSAPVVAAVAATLYFLVLPAFWAQVTYSQHRFALPYEQLAAFVARSESEPLPIVAARHDDAANLVLALGWPGAAEPTREPVGTLMGSEALLVWRGRGDAPERIVPPRYGPAAAIETIVLPYANAVAAEVTFSLQRFERTDAPLLEAPRPAPRPSG